MLRVKFPIGLHCQTLQLLTLVLRVKTGWIPVAHLITRFRVEMCDAERCHFETVSHIDFAFSPLERAARDESGYVPHSSPQLILLSLCACEYEDNLGEIATPVKGGVPVTVCDHARPP